MATVFSTGFVHGCFYQISELPDGLILAKIETPTKVKEATTLDFNMARSWVDRQLAKTIRRDYDEAQ